MSSKKHIVPDVQQFLLRSGRCIRSIAKDGNCFFRTASCHLLGTEREHLAVRTLLLRFENLNQTLFEKRLIPTFNKPSFRDHIRHLSRPSIWCTQVELMALATFYQVPLYYCACSTDGTSYHWEVIKPIATRDSLRYPEIVEEDPLHGIQPQNHFEFLYWECLHFDLIICQETSLPGSSYPDIPSVHHFVTVD